ncbi:MAG: class I SAM-dependent methyltransferase [Gammaproteobacteria bacterium]
MSEQAFTSAYKTCVSRALHQFDAAPLVFDDTAALRLVGTDPRTPGYREDATFKLRGNVVVRSRLAEDMFGDAVKRGIGRLVVLGAGLDSLGIRNPWPQCEVIEVDHPPTQAWKRGLLAERGIDLAANVRLVPIDFERTTLADGLAQHGIHPDRPTAFSWLGVIYYLSLPAIRATLQYVAGCGAGSELCFDFFPPDDKVDSARLAAHNQNAAAAAREGAMFQSLFSIPAIGAELRAAGFTGIELLDRTAVHARYFARREDGLQVVGEYHLGRAMR